MAHITKLKIDGLLGRKEQIEIALDRTTNVFFGENGCGKTTLLKILQCALSLDAETMISLPVERAEIDIYSEKYEKIFTHVWDRKTLISNKKFTPEMLTALTDSDISILEKLKFLNLKNNSNEWRIINSKKFKVDMITRWSHCFLPTTRLYQIDSGRRISDIRLNTEERINEAFAEAVNKRWLLYYTKTLKEVQTIQEEGLLAVLYHSLSLTSNSQSGPTLNPQQTYKRVKKFLARQTQQDASLLGSIDDFTDKYSKDEGLRRVVDNINNVEARIESSMAPIQKFSDTINNLFSREKKLQTTGNGLSIELADGKLITPAQLSSGEKQLLVILLQSMTSGKSSVIIDEPELSMHIDWQYALAETIHTLNPECQLIVASHSPEIMANIADEKIFKI